MSGLGRRDREIDYALSLTLLRLEHGVVYLTAVMDWCTRKVLSWELSNTIDKSFCISALERAMHIHCKPENFNSDQDAQYTCKDFQEILRNADVKISMDGKGRALDNIAIERFLRTLKYGEIYLKEYQSLIEAAEGIKKYIEKYNLERPHSALGDMTPDEMYKLAG